MTEKDLKSRRIVIEQGVRCPYVATAKVTLSTVVDADSKARMKKAYDEFMTWLAGFEMDGDDVARIKAELPDMWTEFRTTSDEVDNAMSDDEDLFHMGLSRLRDVFVEMTGRIGIDAPAANLGASDANRDEE